MVAGKIVHIFNLPNDEAERYVIEIDTPIDPVYEVREYETISPDANGPINLFRNRGVQLGQRFVKKLGMKLPVAITEVESEPDEPTPEQITAALERSEQSSKHSSMIALNNDTKSKRRYFKKKKSNP